MKKVIKIIIVSFLVLFASGFVFAKFFRKQTVNFDFIIAKKQDIIQQVSVTGRVKPSEQKDLSFEKSGKIKKVYVHNRDYAKQGQILAKLEDTDLQAKKKLYQATLELIGKLRILPPSAFRGRECPIALRHSLAE